MLMAFFETVRTLPGGIGFIPRYMEWLDFSILTFAFLLGFFWPFIAELFDIDIKE